MKRDDFDLGNSEHAALHRRCADAIYCALSCCFIVGFLAAVAGFNHWLNPLDYFGVREGGRLTFENPRLTKSLLPGRIQPASIVIGSSRPELANSPEHSGLSHRPLLNLALSRTIIDEMVTCFEHASLGVPVHLAVGFLDYNSCNPSTQAQPTYRADRLRQIARPRSISARLSDVHATLLSWRALGACAWIAAGRNESGYLPPSQRDEHRHYQKILASGGVLRASERTLRALPSAPKGIGDYNWLPLRRMVRTASELNVKVIWILTPLHDAIWESFVRRDGLETVLQWRKKVLEVIQSEADRSGMGEQVCWDFDNTASMRMTMEEVIEEARAADLPLFYEHSHFSSRSVNLILDKVFSDVGPGDFGVLLTTLSVDTRLKQLAIAWQID